MGSETIAFDILLVILCINGGLLLVDAAFVTPLKTPFDINMTVTPITTGLPSDVYTNGTGGLVGNLSSTTAENSTVAGGTVGTLTIFDTIFFPLIILWTFIQFITGAFIWEFLAILGLPSIFVFILQGVIGLLIARMIVYWVWGR